MGACCDSCAASGGSCETTVKSDPVLDGRITFVDREITWKVRKNFRPVRKLKFQGLDISIEHDKGMSREWVDRDGSKGSTKMAYPYGYICRTMGEDDEQVDVYVGPDEDSEKVFIVHQMAVPDFEKYDEDKVMVGFGSAREAKAAYLMHYNNPKFFGTMTSTDMDAFKRMFVKKALGVKRMKTWRKSSKEFCKTDICFQLDGMTIPEDQKFSGIKGYPLDGPPAHTHCKCTLEYSMGKSLHDPEEKFTSDVEDMEEPNHPAQEEKSPEQGLADPNHPVQEAAPVVDPMTGMPMMPIDPHDVETFEGVESLIGRIGSVNDQELMTIAEKVWGAGYNYEGQSPWQARAEILGFLQDQRDLLGVEPEGIEMPDLQPSPSLPVKEPSGSSEYYGSSPNAVPMAPPEVSSSEEAARPPKSVSSSGQDFSSRKLNLPYADTPSPTSDQASSEENSNPYDKDQISS